MDIPNQPVSTVAELAELLEALMTVLEQEQRALQDTTTEPVISITAHKQSLLQQFDQLQPELVRRISDSNTQDDPQTIAQIKQLIAQCKRYNKENGALVSHGLHMCRRSMHFLHGNTQQAIERYNPDGQTTTAVRGRVIGSA